MVAGTLMGFVRSGNGLRRSVGVRLPEMVRVQAVHVRHHARLISEIRAAR